MDDARRVRVALRAAPSPAEVGQTPQEFLAWLGGPTVFRIAGRDRTRTRALVTLLHGNEPSGLRALHAWLRRGTPPAVNLVCFIGAVVAARTAPGFAYRMLPGARDLNRCFLPPFAGPEGEIAGEALRLLRESNAEALIDLHNNTGHNPPYGVGTVIDAARLNLTGLFAERYVHSNLQLGSLMEATEIDMPGVTIECGRAGDPSADATARAGLERYVMLDQIDTQRVMADHVTILDEPVRVCVRPGIRVAFAQQRVDGVDLTLTDDIDRHNFQLLLPGAPVGWVGVQGPWPLEAHNAAGDELSHDFFVVRDGVLETRRGVVPIMMTTDPSIAVADCLCYLVRAREVLPTAS